MKKANNKNSDMINNRMLMFTSIGLMVLAFMTIMLSTVTAQEKMGVAVVLRINGSLEYREDTSSDWKQAKLKQALYDRYQLRTETGNKAVIVYVGSGSRVLINENTELEIQALSTAPGQKPTNERTRLMIGEVYSKVTSGANYDIETPTSVASVRGTEFNSSFSDDGEATYLVYDESVIEVMNQLGSVLLRQLQTISISEGETPSEDEVETLTQSEADDAIEWTEAVDPTWKLNITPEGGETHEVGSRFALTIWAQDPETLSIDANATFALSAFDVSSDVLEFSTDNGKTWTNAPQVTISNGQARVVVRPVSEGSCDITVQAENTEPATTSITVSKVKEKIQIQLIFTNPDGSGEETITLDLEEK